MRKSCKIKGLLLVAFDVIMSVGVTFQFVTHLGIMFNIIAICFIVGFIVGILTLDS